MSNDLNKQLKRARKAGLTAEQIRGMSMDDYARLAGHEPIRFTPVETPEATASTAATEPEAEQESQGKTISEMTDAEYASVREQLGVISKEYGKGALDGAVSREEWAAAAARKSGRTGMNTRNVVESPKIDMLSRTAKKDQAPIGRNDGLRIGGNW